MTGRWNAFFLVVALGLGCATGIAAPPPAPPVARPPDPLAITVAIQDAGFESEFGLGERFARELRRSGFFRGVAHPLREGARSRWMLEFAGRDTSPAVAPPSRTARWARYIPLAAPFVWTEQTHSLELEARLLKSGEPLSSYSARADVVYRYQVYADVQRALLTAQEVARTRAIEALLAEIETSLPQIAAQIERP